MYLTSIVPQRELTVSVKRFISKKDKKDFQSLPLEAFLVKIRYNGPLFGVSLSLIHFDW